MKTKGQKKTKVNIVTLGCSKNLVDSEVLLTQLKGNGIAVSHESAKNDSNIVVINTCGFIDNAKQESIDTILRYVDAKEEGLVEKVYVTGCLSERYKTDLQVEIPQVDAWFGTRDLSRLLKQLNANYKQELVGERILTNPSHFAYLKISEGCDRPCSFCAIPLMRGKHISRPMEELVLEAKNLAKKGVKELLLIAQDSTYYGLDLYKKRNLADLLKALSDVEGIEWIRLHYAYPSKFPTDIFDAMARLPKVCNYLDMPLQHANNAVLQRMRRQITKEETVELIKMAREKVPNIAIRTTMLVGSPGETEAEFEDLCRFVEEMAFERVGVFQYSHEEDTSAFEMADDVPPYLKEERANRLMEIQQDISLRKNQTKVGQTMKVLFDRKEGAYFIGRSEHDSPEVDNEVMVKAKHNYVRIGDFAQVIITEATDYDLYGDIVI